MQRDGNLTTLQNIKTLFWFIVATHVLPIFPFEFKNNQFKNRQATHVSSGWLLHLTLQPLHHNSPIVTPSLFMNKIDNHRAYKHYILLCYEVLTKVVKIEILR